jgi:hypothetical protein
MNLFRTISRGAGQPARQQTALAAHHAGVIIGVSSVILLVSLVDGAAPAFRANWKS